MSDPHDLPVISEDFTIATVIGDETRLLAVHQFLEAVNDGTIITVEQIRRLGGESMVLSRPEAEAVIVGLLLAGAVEKEDRSSPFIEGEFRLDATRAVTILEEQVIALRAIEATSTDRGPQPESTLVATVPPGLGITLPRSVSRLGTKLRSAIIDASSEVRLANPYFDPDQQVMDDLSGLPARGVKTKILTRQMISGTDRFEILQKMTEGLAPADRSNLQVRELHLRDGETGRQVYSTHAKMLVVDNQLCYIGSANLTVTSLGHNFELGIVLEGPEVATATAVFDSVFEAAEPVNLGGFCCD